MKLDEANKIREWIDQEIRDWSNIKFEIEIIDGEIYAVFSELFGKKVDKEIKFRYTESEEVEFYALGEYWQNVSSHDRNAKYFWIELLYED